MNDHWVHSHQFQQHDIAGETLLEVFLDHGVTAIFDDNRFAVKAPDIRQRLSQDFRFIFCGGWR